MRSPWSRFSILLLPDPGPVLRLRSSDSLISGETATFQSYRSSLAHLSSIGNTKHLFVLTKISGDVPDVPSTPGRLFRWSWVLPISPRTDYCFASVNKSSSTKRIYIIPSCAVTSEDSHWSKRCRNTHKYCCYPLTRSLGRTVLAWAGGLRERCRARECY